MVSDNVFGINNTRASKVALPTPVMRIFSALARQLARTWCGMHGHLIMLHFEPNKLSLQCSLCGYESEGWDVGRPLVARGNRERSHAHHVHHVGAERRRAFRAVP